ncbi:MAG: PQQ-binding-like beta-propeller repeat protein [Planctomycetes bacterium]|nr:PQQ-binding-like beta-propeller repeat protein [Planctomycetota bacterium]
MRSKTILSLLAALAPVGPIGTAAQRPRAELGPRGSAAPASGPVLQAPKEEAFDPRPYRIRDTQAAKWQLDEVEAHVAGKRWSEAIDGLQLVLEEHASDVLAPETARLPNGQRAAQPTHYGAAPRARALLFQLPREARAVYVERHEAAARAALARASERLDRRGLWEITRRFPLTRSAQSAAWTLGDLEWEQGHGAEALAGWAHALGLALDKPELAPADGREWNAALGRLRATEAAGAEAGATPSEASIAAIERRVLAATDWLAARAREEDERPAQRSVRGVRPPGRDADAWFEPFLLPSNPFTRGPRLWPARGETQLFVTTSLRVLALDAYSGALLWKTDEPRGWSDLGDNQRNAFFLGVDQASSIVRPAATERVVVAALQVPVAFIKNEDFQGSIAITKIIPDRRLFAFDARDGAPLWNHAPPAGWDGDSGGFLERMSIAGPPVIAERRVLAPCYRMQGRIDYHVGCFDLDTGALLWSTDVISGQRELNMFGRPEKEFCAPPLVVVGDKVIAQTQLGAVACLDLYTGEVRWVSLYEQIPLPRTRDLAAPTRSAPWKNQPPVVSGSTIVATPYDSWDLIGLDLDRGSLLWSVPNRVNGTIEMLAGAPGGRIDQLVGARDDTVYLAGERVLALRSQAGLHMAPPTSKRWPPFNDPAIERDGPSAACVLADDRIVVPTDDRCLSIDLASGRLADEGLAWSAGGGGGNLLVCERELFSVSNRRATGYFEWGVLVQRARRLVQERPGDARAALALGRLLANRGALELERRGRSQEAREALTEARGVLDRALASSPAGARAELEAELHRALRSEARAHAALTDTREAAAALKRARSLAPDTEELRDTLLEELALLRLRAGDARADAHAIAGEREELLKELAARCDGLTMLCDPATETSGGDGAVAADEQPFAFEPIVGGEARANLVPLELPVGLWVLATRERDAVRRKDTAREFEHLHRMLAEYAEVPLLDGNVGGRAAARIGELLRRPGVQGYEPFAQRAEAEFAAAVREKDRERLVRLAHLYPYSPASRKANDARLEWAEEAGAVGEVAAIVQSELPYRWRAQDATPRELDLGLALAVTARTAGNVELADALLREFARVAPAHVPRVRGLEARPLSELAPRPAAPVAPTRRLLPELGRFNADARSQRDVALNGEFELLARSVPADESDRTRDLLIGFTLSGPGGRQRAATLYSVDEDSGGVRWLQELPTATGPLDSGQGPWTRHVATTRGRVLVACADALLALDEATGEVRWTWTFPVAAASQVLLSARSGVALLTLRAEDGLSLHAVDAWSGGHLWSEGPVGPEHHPEPLLGEHSAVSLPMTGRTAVLVRDLFTGRRSAAFDLELPARVGLFDEAWLEDGRLFVPRLLETKAALNQIAAHDLDTGARAWRVAFADLGGEPRYLKLVIQAQKRTYLVLQTQPGQGVQTFQTALYELSTGIGALAPIQNVRLSDQDRIAGLPLREGRGVFTEPTLLVLSPSTGDEARVRAIDLERGELWSQSLGVPWGRLMNASLPQPAWSDRAAVLCFDQKGDPRVRGSVKNTYLAFFDRQSGVLRETRLMEDRWADKADSVVLYPLGDRLFVRGKTRVEVLR